MWQLQPEVRAAMERLRVPAKAILLLLLISSVVSVEVGALDSVELFAGQRALSRACTAAGLRAGFMDVGLHHGHDFCSPKGFACP
jgi:hypothetical protein